MELPKTYNPSNVEEKWYDQWQKNDIFSPSESDDTYTIMIPPPNVTGILHLGHVLNNTIQDILIRKAKMDGKNTLWVPGTDHASIATETKVTKMLKDKGIDKKEIGREKFLDHSWEWTEKYGGIIISLISSSFAIKFDIRGPAPPKARSFNSRGSIPCSIVISLIASAILALLIFKIPLAVSKADMPILAPTEFNAFSAKD